MQIRQIMTAILNMFNNLDFEANKHKYTDRQQPLPYYKQHVKNMQSWSKVM